MQNHLRKLPQTLSNLRAEIDRIDDALMELVDERLRASRAIADAKLSDGGNRLKLRPRREAELVARLAARAPGVDVALIRQIWGALMAYGVQDQEAMELVLCGGGDRLALQDAVRLRFGLAANVHWATDAEEALAAAASREAVAVIAARAPLLLDDDLVIFDTIVVKDTTAYAIGRIAPDDVACSDVASWEAGR